MINSHRLRRKNLVIDRLVKTHENQYNRLRLIHCGSSHDFSKYHLMKKLHSRTRLQPATGDIDNTNRIYPSEKLKDINPKYNVINPLRNASTTVQH